jgi:hypothetical protein
MAASVRAIGGTPRLIHTKGHIYPEILIGTLNDLETVNYLIKNVLFEKESYKSNCTIILMNAVKFGLTLIIQLPWRSIHVRRNPRCPHAVLNAIRFLIVPKSRRNEVWLHADK